jgi:valyl-tRNA synthetase
MSKSRGNVIDPLIIIDKYGADAFRFTLTAFAAKGRDIKLSEERIEGYRNFVNKIWNASRFIIMNLEEDKEYKIDFDNLLAEDKWVLGHLKTASENIVKQIENYDFNDVANEMYHFFWHTFCDWYIEFIKHRIFNDIDKDNALATAIYVLEKSLIMLHPIMPFVTEYIYSYLTKGNTIMDAQYPEFDFDYTNEVTQISFVTELISMIRNIRGEYDVQPGAKINIKIKTENNEIKKLFDEKSDIISKLARLDKIEYTEKDEDNSAMNVAKEFTLFIPLSGLIDYETELKRLEKEKKALDKDFKLYGGKLKNEKYLAKAPEHVVEKDKKKFEEVSKKLEEINNSIERIKKLC